MKKVLIIGNFNGDTGPSIVNNSIRKELVDNNNIIFLDNKDKKYIMLIKLIKVIFFVDIIHLLGVNGVISIISIIFSKLLRKKIIYTAHGCVKVEDKKNNRLHIKEQFIEKLYIKYSNSIIVVSNLMKEQLSSEYPCYTKKINVVYNGYEYDENLYYDSKRAKNNIIVSLGGGRREKGNLKICKALNLIKSEKFTYIVIGEDGIDTAEIKSFKFVNYLGSMSNNEVKLILSKSKLFIQFSEFESFGMAPLEALNANCDIIISDKMGVVELLNSSNDNIVFHENISIEELSKIIENKLKNPTEHKRFNYFKWSNVRDKYIEIWNKI